MADEDGERGGEVSLAEEVHAVALHDPARLHGQQQTVEGFERVSGRRLLARIA